MGTCHSTLIQTVRMRAALSPAPTAAPLRRSRPLKDPLVKPLPFPNLRVVSDGVENTKRCGEKPTLL